MKVWEKVLAVGAATLLVIIAACAVGIVLYPTEDVSNPPIESQEPIETPAPPVAEPVEEEMVDPCPEMTIQDIYNVVELGMTEDEVRAIAGEPTMSSNVEVEGWGTMKDLVYSDNGNLMDNVSIFIEGDTVSMIVIGTFDGDGNIDTQTKM